MTKQKNEDLTKELLLLTYTIRKRLIIICAVLFAISIIIYKLCFIHYSSSVTFLIDNSNPSEVTASETEEFALKQLKELSNNRMYALIFSDEMARRMETSIKIGEHFHLDKNRPDFIRNVLAVIQSKINLVNSGQYTLSILAKDDDPEYAALLANSVYENLVSINKQTVLDNLNYKKGVYNLDVSQIESKYQKDAESFRQALYQLQTNDKKVNGNYDDMYLLKRDLLNLFSEYDKSLSELKKYELKYQITLNTISDTSLRILYLINSAYPESKKEINLSAFIWSAVIGILGSIYYCIFLLYKQKFRRYLSEFIPAFKNGNSKFQLNGENTVKNDKHPRMPLVEDPGGHSE